MLGLGILYCLGLLGFLFFLRYFVNKSVGTVIRDFIEENLGSFPHFLIYCVLEWFVIVLIYVDGLLSFASNEISRLFELNIPCLLCTRIDHAVGCRNSSLYYNESICEVHKQVVSSLAYCDAHKKLSDSHTMCQGCFLSEFHNIAIRSAENDFEFDSYKSIIGILRKDVDLFLEDDQNVSIEPLSKDEAESVSDEESGILRCSCCGEPLKSRASSKHKRSSSESVPAPANSPCVSPREPLVQSRTDEGGNVDSPHVRDADVKLESDVESEILEDEDTSSADSHGRADHGGEAAAAPSLPDSDDTNEDTSRTLSFSKGNKFFGSLFSDSLPDSDNTNEDYATTLSFSKGNKFLGSLLSDSSLMSPHWTNRGSRKFTIERVDSSVELNDAGEADGDLLARLKQKVHLNRNSLMALQMELDEERSASAVAANNAMAMITRLQAEKAAVQMEALQYQRMKQEQSEYDQEALQAMKDLLIKREEDMKALEAEIKLYREKYGQMKNIGSEVCEVDMDDDYQDIKSQAMSTLSEKSECDSVTGGDPIENENGDESAADFEGDRSYLLGLLKNIEGGLLKNIEGNAGEPSNAQPNSSELDGVVPGGENRGSAGVQNKATLNREVSMIRERLRVMEADSGFLKHTATALQREGEGTKLLTEIAQHLRKLRQHNKFPSDALVDA